MIIFISPQMVALQQKWISKQQQKHLTKKYENINYDH